MNLTNISDKEILARGGLAVDCLINQMYDKGSFINWATSKNGERQRSDNADDYYQLLAVSLLYTASQAFNKPYLVPYADQISDTYISKSVNRNESRFILDPRGSLSACNALMSHLLFKRSAIKKEDNLLDESTRCKSLALKYANSLIECVSKKILKNVPGTGPETISNQPGMIIMSLLEAFGHTNDEKYLRAAEAAGNLIPSYQQLNPYNAWGLALLWEASGVEQNEAFFNHIRSISQSTEIESEVATGIVISYMLQSANAYSLTFLRRNIQAPDMVRMRVQDALNIQKDFQVDFNHDFGYDVRKWAGAIVKSSFDPLIRIDYIVYTVFGFLQYLFLLKKGHNNINSLYIY